MTVMTNTNMKIKIQYPETKCADCGKTFKKTHNRQTYCSTEGRQKGDREKAGVSKGDRKRDRKGDLGYGRGKKHRYISYSRTV